ncbi:hypothetical protein D9M70_308530 [compost metagenome]
MVPADSFIFKWTPIFSALVVFYFSASVIECLVAFRVGMYSIRKNAIALLVVALVYVMQLLLGLHTKKLIDDAISSGVYMICPHKPASKFESKAYSFVLKPKSGNLQCGLD